MSSPFRFTSVAQKLTVSLTGLFLCAFLVIHLIGNLQVFKEDQGLAFNKYAVFMTTNPLIMIVSWGLYATILFHAFKGLFLAWKNQKSRKVNYHAYKGNSNSKWFSRYMGVLGTIILIFIVVHMTNFWYNYKFGHTPYSVYTENLVTGVIEKNDIPSKDNEPIINNKMEEFVSNDTRITIIKDLYKSVKFTFQSELWIVILYVFSMVAISFHLLHGFQSAFQTLGLGNRNLMIVVRFLGTWVFGLLIPIGFALMPIYMYVIQYV